MVAIAPTDYLQHKLDPISFAIDGFGGPHVLMGLIASGGQPHIYVIGNVHGNLKKEIYEALAHKLLEMAADTTTQKGVVIPGPGSLIT